MYAIALFMNRHAEPIIKHADNFGELLDVKDLFFYNRILSDSERSYSVTSPWMNRMDIGEEYVIIPKYLEHEWDMRLAVSDKCKNRRKRLNGYVRIGHWEDQDVD